MYISAEIWYNLYVIFSDSHVSSKFSILRRRNIMQKLSRTDEMEYRDKRHQCVYYSIMKQEE